MLLAQRMGAKKRGIPKNTTLGTMEEYATYIESIEIESLWHGRKHIRWKLDPQVNVLSGINGVGKSTILRHIERGVKDVDEARKQGIHVEVYPHGAKKVRFDVIHTPETRQEFDETLMRLITPCSFNGETEGGNRNPSTIEEAEKMPVFSDKLYDIIDHLFAPTGKTVMRERAGIVLSQYGEELDMHKLSAGEKQMLIILLTVWQQEGKPSVLFLDEPEMSLHFEWQKQLIELILELNPSAQIILTTHSPAIVMDGWMDRVVDVSDLEK